MRMVLRFLYRLLIIVPITLSILLGTLFLFYKLPAVTVFDSSQVMVGSETEIVNKLMVQDRTEPLSQSKGLFYFNIRRGYVPDSIHIIPLAFRGAFLKLGKEVGNPGLMNHYALWVRSQINNTEGERLIPVRQLMQLLESMDIRTFQENMEKTTLAEIDYPSVWTDMVAAESQRNHPTLKMTWNGPRNLFHYYLTAIFTNQRSMVSPGGESIPKKFRRTMSWTIAYTVPVLVVGWFVVLVFVLWFYNRPKVLSAIDRGFVLVYSFPTFVLATLALVFLTSHRYGFISRLFPFPVFSKAELSGIADIYSHYGYHLLLPMIVFGISPMILFFRVFYEKITSIKKSEFSYRYLVHAGLSEHQFRFRYLSRHLFVTTWAMVSNLFVAALGGSLIIEWIFNIPGLGRYLYESIVNYDIPSSVYLIVVFTLVQQMGHLISDLIIECFFTTEYKSAGWL